MCLKCKTNKTIQKLDKNHLFNPKEGRKTKNIKKKQEKHPYGPIVNKYYDNRYKPST